VELRLFPLQTVLFPGMTLPLNVFEDRYLQLVRECTEAREPFGVSLIREGPEVGGPAVPFAVGTTARIARMLPGGEPALRLIAVGEQRFRIDALHTDRPYVHADVELLGTVAARAPSSELVEHARTLLAEFEQLRMSARGEVRPRADLSGTPSAAGALADAIGATGAGRADDRQALLETLDDTERLARAIELIEADLPPLRRRVSEAVLQRWSGPGGLN
jgi:Lon protease-like protein